MFLLKIFQCWQVLFLFLCKVALTNISHSNLTHESQKKAWFFFMQVDVQVFNVSGPRQNFTRFGRAARGSNRPPTGEARTRSRAPGLLTPQDAQTYPAPVRIRPAT